MQSSFIVFERRSDLILFISEMMATENSSEPAQGNFFTLWTIMDLIVSNILLTFVGKS